MIVGTNVRRTYVRRTIVRCQVSNKELFEMSTGTIVTPSWENDHMNENLQFSPVFNELSSNEIIRFSGAQEAARQTIESQNLSTPKTTYFRRRFLVGLLLVIVGAIFWTAISLVVGVGEKQVGADLTNSAPREIYIVAPGDTLWSIAGSIDNDGDPRDTVDRLAALNGGSSIYVGQRLILSS